MNATLTATQTATETVQERDREQEGKQKPLHPAIFIVPLLIAAVAAIPSVFALLMVRAFMGLLSGLVHHQISVFDNYFYILVFSPAIVLAAAVFVVTLVVYGRSARQGIRFSEGN